MSCRCAQCDAWWGRLLLWHSGQREQFPNLEQIGQLRTSWPTFYVYQLGRDLKAPPITAVYSALRNLYGVTASRHVAMAYTDGADVHRYVPWRIVT